MPAPALSLLLLAASLAATPVVAGPDAAPGALAEPAPARAAPVAEQAVREELRGMLARLVDAGAFADTPPEGIALALALPAERVVDLGAVLDARSAGPGIAVLAVSPGGLAAELGLRRGDTLLALDGAALGGGEAAIGALRAALEAADDGSRLRLSLSRSGTPIELEGSVRARYLPPIRIELGEGALLASTAPLASGRAIAVAAPAAEPGCGRISVFHVAPRSRGLYPAKILALNGRIPGPARQDTYRVPAGRHELRVAEQIDSGDLPAAFTRQRALRVVAERSLTVEVEPNRTVLIAARLLDTGAADAGRYWEPVAWKVLEEPCR